MSRFDPTRASDLVLFSAVRAALGLPAWRSLPLDTTTRRCLEAFAAVLVEAPNEDFQELAALRTECRKKTRAEYDREIGDLLRASIGRDGSVSYLERNCLGKLCALGDQSLGAPEGEP